MRNKRDDKKQQHQRQTSSEQIYRAHQQLQPRTPIAVKHRHYILFVLTLFLCLTSLSLSACPNQCSGHGVCKTGNTCSCFPGWRGGAPDCSFRECPQGPAWADLAIATDVAHQNVECSNAGVCDRTTGACSCFSGFTGFSCQRSKYRYILRSVFVKSHFCIFTNSPISLAFPRSVFSLSLYSLLQVSVQMIALDTVFA